jgi:hypothetical protein
MNRAVKEMHMPEINLPEVRLPDFKWPEGLRDMNREDIVNAARDVRLPKRSDLPDIDFSKIDLSKVELPKQITDRMPNRKRPNPILPIAGLLAVGAAIVAAWFLITSPVTGPRIRSAVNELKARMNGESNGLVRYDNDSDLGSLLTDSSDASRSSMTSEPYASSAGMSDLADGVPVGPGAMPEGARSN